MNSMDNKPKVLRQKYDLGRLIGQGTFAKVYYGRSVETNQSVAIKVIDKEKILKAGLTDQIKREISIMKIVRHPNVIQLYEVIATKCKVYFVMEYAKGGELFGKITRGRLKEGVARKYFQQLIHAVDFCHSRGVYHRDIKPENLLLDENDNLKVTDFGLSALAESQRRDGLLHTTCGTPSYVAPEVISHRGYDGAKADVWSCGVVLFVLLAGYLPFNDANLMVMYRKIGKADFKCPNWFPPDVHKLISRMLDPNPDTRVCLQKVKESSWFKKGQKNKRQKTEPQSSDTEHSVHGNDSASYMTCETSPEPSPLRLNAFDIISLSAGFDLSGLFDVCSQHKESRFISGKPASAILLKLQDVAKKMNLSVTKKEKGLLKIQTPKEGRKGILSIDAEIFEITPTCHLVEMKKINGDSLEYHEMVEQDMRPALQDIVWIWQGEQEERAARS